MKKNIVLIMSLAVLFLLALVTSSLAETKGKEVTITGDGKCAKCMLKETAKCQTVIQTEQNGKTETYYLAKNDVSDNFHENVCKDTKKITATGTVKEVDGKKELVASKIELAN